jgi:hypothetical protein
MQAIEADEGRPGFRAPKRLPRAVPAIRAGLVYACPCLAVPNAKIGVGAC